MAQLVRSLLLKHEEQSLTQHSHEKLGIMVRIWNPSTGAVKIDISMVLTSQPR